MGSLRRGQVAARMKSLANLSQHVLSSRGFDETRSSDEV